jgi:dihydroorotase-like cyclic amidohydrolase
MGLVNGQFHSSLVKLGWKLKGRAVATIVAGKLIWSEQSELNAV